MDILDKEVATSDKEIQKLKDSLEKKHGRDFTWEEASDAMFDVKRFVELTFEVVSEKRRRDELLNEHPRGFHFDRSGYTCQICDSPASGTNSWFDKYGLKCMTCQKAIDGKIVPAAIAKHKESWYSKYELETYFNIKGADLNKYIKQSILKNRIIPGAGKKVHLQLFLIKDNKDVLPPKKIFKSRTVKVMWNGEEYYSQEYWYEFIDEKLLKRLAKYKIVECLKDTLAKPIKTGRFLFKGINPIFSFKEMHS